MIQVIQKSEETNKRVEKIFHVSDIHIRLFQRPGQFQDRKRIALAIENNLPFLRCLNNLQICQ